MLGQDVSTCHRCDGKATRSWSSREALGEEDLRIEPNVHGRFVVMGGHWMWEEVPVDAADTVHGIAERP